MLAENSATNPIEKPRPNPQKNILFIQRLSRAPWWLLIILGMILAFVVSVADSSTYQLAWAEVKQGIWTTVWVTVVAYGISLILGFFLALMRRPSTSLLYNTLIYQPATVIVEFIRGIPTLVLVFYMTLAFVPQMVTLVNGLGQMMLENRTVFTGVAEWMVDLTARDIPTVYRAIVALAISYAAFLSEIFRAGLDSVDVGQHEAARSLGMNRRQIIWHIVLPQATRNILPALGNDFIAMLKESSLVSVAGVQDITRMGQSFSAATFTFFQSYNVVAITYLVMTLILSVCVKLLELYISRGRQTAD